METWGEGMLQNDDAADAVAEFYSGIKWALRADGRRWLRASAEASKEDRGLRYLGLLYVALECRVGLSKLDVRLAKKVIVHELTRCSNWRRPTARARALGKLRAKLDDAVVGSTKWSKKKRTRKP
jgi:hypothetical protein